MRKVLTILYSIVFAVLLTGCGADQAMKKGDKFFALGEYFDAATQYRKAYTHTPNKEREKKGQRAMKVAECYRLQAGRLTDASLPGTVAHEEW